MGGATGRQGQHTGQQESPNPICCWGFLSGMLSLDTGSMWSQRSRVLPDTMA